MTSNICIEIKIQSKSAEAIARAGIREDLPAFAVKSKLLKILHSLQAKHQEFSQEIANSLDVDRIYLEALEKEKALVESR
ncbi:MAG: hypothetical protein ACFBSE_24085 [Prochloraceae cyanobacterium]